MSEWLHGTVQQLVEFAGWNAAPDALSWRLALVMALAFVAVFFIFRSIGFLIAKAAPLLARGYANGVELLSRRSWAPLRRVARWLDPEDPKFPGRALWSGIFLTASAGFIAVLHNLSSSGPLVRADGAINRLVQSLTTGPIDKIMVTITATGDGLPLIAGAGAVFGLLAMQRAWRTAGAAAVTIGTAAVLVPVLKLIVRRPRPIDIYTGADAYSFPSGHTAMSAVLIGVMAVLVTRALPVRAKILIFGTAASWVGLVGMSRIYLSAHWASDVLGGLLLGMALVAAFAWFIEHRDVETYRRSILAAGFLAVFAIASGIHAYFSFDKNTRRYEPRETTQTDGNLRQAYFCKLTAGAGSFVEPTARFLLLR